MKKAFSLLEIIITLIVISIILSFAVSKYDTIFNSSNLTKLKSEFALIQNGVSNLKSKNILLSQKSEVTSLDNAISLKSNEKLFSNVIDFTILSTDSKDKQKGKWLKSDSFSYEYFLQADKKISFKLKNSSFLCVKPIDICKELE